MDLKLLRNPSFGARKNRLACAFLDFFDRCANPFSLYPPQAALESVARAMALGFKSLLKRKRRNQKGFFFFLAEKEGFEPSRHFRALLP